MTVMHTVHVIQVESISLSLTSSCFTIYFDSTAMDDAWIESSQHVVAYENGKVVLYAFPSVVCYKCPFCGPSSVLRTIAGQARHLGICSERKKMQLEMIGNPRKFKFVGFSSEALEEMCYEDGVKQQRTGKKQDKSSQSMTEDSTNGTTTISAVCNGYAFILCTSLFFVPLCTYFCTG